MTDKERQRLCYYLRKLAQVGPTRVPICAEAADEIERLANDLKMALQQFYQARDRCDAFERRIAELETK
jgi:hypothetical protein